VGVSQPRAVAFFITPKLLLGVALIAATHRIEKHLLGYGINRLFD
jgi:hypothetical protein